ncbi:hypothetical protein VLK31_19655 [Variovorax sp. H27-G14]|uniref:hypothetical protein n=1 Tax=Variovorax sp. H27-G14 TaxID=3111914 RepID=UPI0038FCECE4
MKKFIFPLALILAPWIAPSALAQGQGEADSAGAKSPPTQATSPTERRDARAARRRTGVGAARGAQPGEGASEPERDAPLPPRFSAAERKAAALQRSQANSAANKAGRFSRGGNGDAPEKQKR